MTNLNNSDNQIIKKALWTNVVGNCILLAKECCNKHNGINEQIFYSYYLNETNFGQKALDKSKDIIVSQGIDHKVAEDWVYKRVIHDTVNGIKYEYKVLEMLNNIGYNVKFASNIIDKKYAVDLISDTFAIQVKPYTYKIGNNPILKEDKKIHIEQHKEFYNKYNKQVYFIYYKTNGQIDFNDFTIWN